MISRFLSLATRPRLLGVVLCLTAGPLLAAETTAPVEKPRPPFQEDFGRRKVGEVLPDFALQSADGQMVKFSDYAAGKPVVLGFFPADGTRMETVITQWETLWKKYRDTGVVFLGIGAFGAREEFDSWRARTAEQISFAIAFDPAGTLSPAAKTREQMTPDELKAERARQREYFDKVILTQLCANGGMPPLPAFIAVDAERKLIGWFFGPDSMSEAIPNLLLRAGLKLAAADMPAKVWSHEETKEVPRPAMPRVEMIKAGAAAPDFTTIDLHGKPVKLSDYQGKIVVLDFWATWCGPCIASMPHTQEVAKTYKDQDVVVLGSCTLDTRDAFEKWVKANQEKYPDFIFSHDPGERAEGKVLSQKLYGVGGIPTQIVIGRDGKVVDVVLGYAKGEVLLEGALAKAGVKVDPAIVAKAKIDQQKRDAEK
jgi:peroxiredoxin